MPLTLQKLAPPTACPAPLQQPAPRSHSWRRAKGRSAGSDSISASDQSPSCPFQPQRPSQLISEPWTNRLLAWKLLSPPAGKSSWPIWFMICALWYKLYDIHFMIYALWYMLYSIYALWCSLWYMLYDIHYSICFTVYTLWYMLFYICFMIYTLWYMLYSINALWYTLWYTLYDIYTILYALRSALYDAVGGEHFLFTWTFSLQTSHLGLWTIKTRLDCTQIVVGFLPLNTSAVKEIFEIELAWGLCSCSKCVIKIQHKCLVWKWFFKTFSTEGKISYFNVSFQGYKYSIAPWE